MITLNGQLKFTILLCLFLIGCLIFLWILTGKWMADGQKPVADGTNEYAVILGAKVNGDVPSLSLRYRLDVALGYANDSSSRQICFVWGTGA